jgi:Family of unknown function (DUF6941)
VKVSMMLADAAQAVEGKLYILGGGWSITGPEPTPSAIAAYIQVPWDRTNVQHEFRFELLDSDGDPVVLEGPDGDAQPVTIEGAFEVGRPVGVRPGTPIDVPLALNIGPLALRPGGRFEWRLAIDGETDDDWRLAFSTRPAV